MYMYVRDAIRGASLRQVKKDRTGEREGEAIVHVGSLIEDGREKGDILYLVPISSEMPPKGIIIPFATHH